MNQIVYHRYSDAASHARTLAETVAALLRHHVCHHGEAVLAVSGGRSPVAFFQALAQQDLPWQQITVTLVDERWVPAGHADSNGALVRQHLLQQRAALARWRPLVDESMAEDFFRQPANLAHSLAQAQAAYVQPDVVVLGMGEDGHTASLFPQAPQLAAALDDAAPPLVHTSPQTAPHERIGLSLPALSAAGQVLLAIGGADKYRVLQQALAAADVLLPVARVAAHAAIRLQVHYFE